ncbi:hypothetical protein KIN20_025928 [Parelaphostrongylus tenuis]|uniref:PNPLA domain-containing protein n=1 Tax=Parelaphostrongylus tenuis TaxID=148309 RepID=A0AAD5MYY8_PARTN|nr:hypothetical protein KIN20_025928 [Parelaphostrongylus tenuis]
MARGVIAFTVYDALWEQKNNAGETPIDVATPRNPDENYKVLLSFDGGGIKAILEAGILRAIQNELGEHLMSRIHWVGGTSCGGITSLALGAGLTVEQTRRLFLSGRQLAFCGNNRVLPKHNSNGIEDMLRVSFGAHTTMGQLKTQKVLVTAAKIKAAPPQLVLFRSYAPRITPKEYEKYGYMNPEKILMWKAARATSAAPIFFESYHGLADGAIFCNNPCLTMMTDFFRLQRLENHKNIKNVDKIGCIITVGSGIEPLVPLDGIDIDINWNSHTFVVQCTSSHAAVSQAREWAHSLRIPYFRFSPRLSRAYDLDSIASDGIFDFMFETEVYLRTQAHKDIEDLCRLLKSMPKADVQDYNAIVH